MSSSTPCSPCPRRAGPGSAPFNCTKAAAASSAAAVAGPPGGQPGGRGARRAGSMTTEAGAAGRRGPGLAGTRGRGAAGRERPALGSAPGPRATHSRVWPAPAASSPAGRCAGASGSARAGRRLPPGRGSGRRRRRPPELLTAPLLFHAGLLRLLLGPPPREGQLRGVVHLAVDRWRHGTACARLPAVRAAKCGRPREASAWRRCMDSGLLRRPKSTVCKMQTTAKS